MNTKRKLFNKIIISIIVGIIAWTMVVPLVWMVSTSFKFEKDVFAFPVQWIPQEWNAINNYREVIFGKYSFLQLYKNSIIYAGSTVVLYLLLCSLAAYAFAKINFKYKDKLFLLILATMMIPPQLLVIPQFMIINKLGLYDTLTGLAVRVLFSSYGVFLLRQFMITIPDSVIESAKIDGSGYLNTFFRIVMPMTKPALSTLAILKFVWSWNDYQGPLIFLRSKEKYTLQLGISQFVAADGMGQIYSLTMAGAVLAIVPLFIIFIIFQKQVVGGIAAGAVKG